MSFHKGQKSDFEETGSWDELKYELSNSKSLQGRSWHGNPLQPYTHSSFSTNLPYEGKENWVSVLGQTYKYVVGDRHFSNLAQHHPWFDLEDEEDLAKSEMINASAISIAASIDSGE